ncbi:hypothetical protein SDC9_123574 [bioreactor metagenome]|uniref:Uncharacterized protein n=1 Tax=bioreactor metagenome TaxID=1076179 RepID=A0A645CHZ8_9ZZZZ
MQIERGLQAHFKCAQVAVVDAQQRRLELEGAVEFLGVVHLHQHRHVQRTGDVFHLHHLGIFKAGSNQQHGIGAHRTRFVDLVWVDHEILAQHRQQATSTCLLQVVRLALKELAIGQHRQAGRTHLAVALCIALCDVGGDEVFANHALARAGLFHLGDHRRLILGNLGLESAHKVAREHTALGVAPHVFERHALFGCGDFFDLDVADFFQDVGHAFLTPLRPIRPQISA